MSKQLEFNFAKGLEGKLQRPKNFWDAWNAAKKIPFNERKYQPRADFAYANGREAKQSLSIMFPNESNEIDNLNANQAMKAYFDIRGVYFS